MKLGQFTEFTAVLLLILMVMAGIFFIKPMRTEIMNLEEQETELSQELETLTANLDDLNQLSSQVSEDAAASETLLTAVPLGFAQDDLLVEINQIAEDLSFQFTSLSFSESTTELGNSVTVMGSFLGTYEDLVSFLQAIESASRLMQVSSISVQRTTEDQIVFNINLEAFYQ